MNVYNSLIISAEYDYDSDAILSSQKINELSKEDKLDLLSYFLTELKLDKDLFKTLNPLGFYTCEQIKEQKGILISNEDKIYYNYYSGVKELSEYNYHEFIQGNPDFCIFIPAKLTKEHPLYHKFEEIKKKKDKEAKSRAEKRKLKEIEKARKILEKNKVFI